MEESFYDPGYDPSGDAGLVCQKITGATAPPAAYVISPNMLPPAGTQGSPAATGAPGSCAAWASTYDLATAAAARAGGYNPSTPELQASPAFIYMQVIGISAPPCKGSSLQDYFHRLENSGTPTMANAPYVADCDELVILYHNPPNPPPNDSRFKLPFPTVVDATDADSIQQALSQNRPLAYGTGLYTDWGAYKGVPIPYVGNGIPAKSGKTGKLVGHCMMIIGYDNNMPYTDRNGQQQKGAYRIQNSEGTGWGDNGYVWMAYETFLALAQGKCFAY